MNVIGLSGFAQVGKDSAAGFLAEFGYKRLAFADILRQSVYNLNPIVALEERFDYVDGVLRAPELVRVQYLVDRMGWDHCKVVYPEIRDLLQRFGTEVGRTLYGETFWVDVVMDQIPMEGTHSNKVDGTYAGVGHPFHAVGNFVITDVRFPNEAEAVRNVGGSVFRIERPGVGAVNSHVSEQILPYDVLVPNTGDLAEFRRNVLSAAGLNVD